MYKYLLYSFFRDNEIKEVIREDAFEVQIILSSQKHSLCEQRTRWKEKSGLLNPFVLQI